MGFDTNGLDFVLCSWQESAILINLDFLVGKLVRNWRRDKKLIQLSRGEIGMINDETCFLFMCKEKRLSRYKGSNLDSQSHANLQRTKQRVKQVSDVKNG